MSYRLEFEIPGLPKRYNEVSRGWRIRSNESQKWHRLVGLVVSGKRPPLPLVRARLILTRFSSASPDADGLVSTFKFVIDGLVKSGILLDDRWENIQMPHYQWKKVPAKHGKIHVVVEELE